MIERIRNFIAYHNAVPVAVVLIAGGSAVTLAASPDIRGAALGSLVGQESKITSVDNTVILAADLDEHDFKLRITDITEDENEYLVTYVLTTYTVKDAVWRELEDTRVLKVSKDALAGRDLGVYCAKELKEVVDYERSFLKDTQALELVQGATKKIETITYSGLVGRFLNDKEKVFPGYEQVVEDVLPAPDNASTTLADPGHPDSGGFAKAAGGISGITEEQVTEIVRKILGQTVETAPTADPVQATAIVDSGSSGTHAAGTNANGGGQAADGEAAAKKLPTGDSSGSATSTPPI